MFSRDQSAQHCPTPTVCRAHRSLTGALSSGPRGPREAQQALAPPLLPDDGGSYASGRRCVCVKLKHVIINILHLLRRNDWSSGHGAQGDAPTQWGHGQAFEGTDLGVGKATSPAAGP